MTPSVNREYIGSIDGLRGLAILMVVFHHTLGTPISSWMTNRLGVGYPYLVGNGWMGVGLFFMLSGFVLAVPYFSNSRKLVSADDFRGYFRHRALRLLPLFVFMALVSYFLEAARGYENIQSLSLVLSTASMFTTREFFPTINPSFWSLMVEIWFRVLFPFMLLPLKQNRFGIVVLSVLFGSLSLRISGAYFPFENVYVNPVKDFVVARLDDFLVGMLIAYAFTQHKLPRRHRGFMFIAGWLTIGFTALLWELRMQEAVPLFAVAGFNNLAHLGFGLILISVLQPGWPRACLSLWGLRVLGAMCFSVYCWQGLLITPSLRLDPFEWKTQLQYWFSLIVLSSLTYRFIEFPKERSLAKLFRFKDPVQSGCGKTIRLGGGPRQNTLAL